MMTISDKNKTITKLKTELRSMNSPALAAFSIVPPGIRYIFFPRKPFFSFSFPPFDLTSAVVSKSRSYFAVVIAAATKAPVSSDMGRNTAKAWRNREKHHYFLISRRRGKKDVEKGVHFFLERNSFQLFPQ